MNRPVEAGLLDAMDILTCQLLFVVWDSDEIWKFECESEMLLSSPFSQKCVFVRARARAPFFVSSHPLLSAPVVQGGSRLFKAAVVIAA
jgi:hypothetical protein